MLGSCTALCHRPWILSTMQVTERTGYSLRQLPIPRTRPGWMEQTWRMAPRPPDTDGPSPPLDGDFWGKWLTRVVIVFAAIATVVGVAVLGNPEHESWQTKTRQVVHG